jgi:hypothetical protein
MFAKNFHKLQNKLGWADVAQTQYCRNVRENLINRKKVQKLAKISAKMFAKIFHKLPKKTNTRIKKERLRESMEA